jgi:Lon protease-like protein
MQDAFPTRFPIFPLPNAVLFPGAQLPLHIFEPRYRQMTADALEGDGVIGMVLIRPGESPMQPRAPIFQVGCAGHMSHVQRLPDGRFNFVLTGERRFRIARECNHDRLYRVVEAELLEDPGFAQLSEAQREDLTRAAAHLQLKVLELARVMAPRSVEPLRKRIAGLDPVLLCGFLSFALDCSPVEKQGVLEAADPLVRLETLIRVVEFRKAELANPGGGSSVN